MVVQSSPPNQISNHASAFRVQLQKDCTTPHLFLPTTSSYFPSTTSNPTATKPFGFLSINHNSIFSYPSSDYIDFSHHKHPTFLPFSINSKCLPKLPTRSPPPRPRLLPPRLPRRRMLARRLLLLARRRSAPRRVRRLTPPTSTRVSSLSFGAVASSTSFDASFYVSPHLKSIAIY